MIELNLICHVGHQGSDQSFSKQEYETVNRPTSIKAFTKPRQSKEGWPMAGGDFGCFIFK
jgi:hypothetical protein